MDALPPIKKLTTNAIADMKNIEDIIIAMASHVSNPVVQDAVNRCSNYIQQAIRRTETNGHAADEHFCTVERTRTNQISALKKQISTGKQTTKHHPSFVTPTPPRIPFTFTKKIEKSKTLPHVPSFLPTYQWSSDSDEHMLSTF